MADFTAILITEAPSADPPKTPKSPKFESTEAWAAIDAARVRCGLAKPQWYKLLGIEGPWDASNEKDELLPSIAARADTLLALNAEFRAEVADRVRAEARYADYIGADNQPVLSTSQVERALGISAFHIATARRRDKIRSILAGRYHGFPLDDVLAFVNEEKPTGYQSPLTGPFVRYVAERDAEAA